MRSLLADLHIHTVLSPCAEIEMIPPFIVHRAQELGLEIIAVTDHNTAANAGAVIEAAQDTGIIVLPGMEVQTREEVHMLCLFDTLAQAEAWQEQVSAALPHLPNREAFFGAQYIVDASGEYIATEERLLATSTNMSVEQVVEKVNHLGGACLPAHIDRPSYGLLANLGFIPPGLNIAGVELSRQVLRLTIPEKLVELYPALLQYGFIVNSDAHRLAEMGSNTRIWTARPTLSELRLALNQEQGRHIDLIWPEQNVTCQSRQS